MVHDSLSYGGLRSPHPASRRRVTFALLAALVFTFAISAVDASRAAFATDAAKFEAESMALTGYEGGRLQVADNADASGGKEVIFFANGSATKSFDGQPTHVLVRAKGQSCNGAPTMIVSVDGSRVGETPIRKKQYDDYDYGVSGLTAEGHTLKVEFTNDYNNAKCDRNLIVDYATVTFPDTSPPSTECPVGQFNAEYRNEVKGFTSSPVLTSCVSAPLDYDWSTSSPGADVNSDNFTSLFEGTFQFESGDYEFDVTTNDGMRVYVDDQLIIDEWYDHLGSHTATTTMSPGEHTVRVEHYEGADDAKVAVSWARQVPGLSSGAVMKADEFVSSIGVNTHFAFTWEPAYQNEEAIIPLIRDANVRLVREHVYYEPGHPNDAERLGVFRKLAANGFGISCIVDNRTVGMNPPTAWKIDYVNQNSGGACSYFEGSNEPDLGGQSVAEITSHQQALYNAVNGSSRPDVPVVGPSIVQKSFAQMAGTSWNTYTDKGNMHPYHGDFNPSFTTNDMQARLDAHRAMTPGKPIVSTEDGWDTAPDAQDRSVSESVQSKYSLRDLFWSVFDADFERVILYEMVDESQSKGFDNEGTYGLLRSDLSPKPSYTSLKRLLGLLAEPNAPAFTPAPLDYSLSGDVANVKSYQLQKSNGTHYVVLYQDVPSWNPNTNSEISNPPVSVRLDLANPASRLLVHSPQQGVIPVSDTSGPVSGVSLNVPDYPIVVEVFH
jgi:Ca-dependent carbohydrate-binding module xylan-binding/PA14 domain